ncbi:MAG: histidine kinase [Sinobacterium sp.]|nr:histidine kinase [Sinobacterium sp.]
MALQSQSEESDFFQLPDLLSPRRFALSVMTAQLLVMLLALYTYGFNFDWSGFAKMTIYVQWQVTLSVFILSQARKRINHLSTYSAAAVSYGLLLSTGFVVALMAQWVSNIMGGSSFNGSMLGRNFLMSAIVAGIALRYMFIQQQLIHREKAAVLASLASLQARIKPHFLFNTMNSIASLIGFAPDKAEKMVEDLSALLRESLKGERVETTIDAEWALCERYLSIELLRLGDRLNWTCDFSNLNMGLPIPSLTLQPIIENAIYHGIQPSIDKGFIRVHGEFLDDIVKISIENSQSQTEQSQRSNKGNKMAIGNIRHRIQQLYGDSASLELIDQVDSFKTVLTYRPSCSAALSDLADD